MFDIDAFKTLNNVYDEPKEEGLTVSRNAPIRQSDLESIYTVLAELKNRVHELETKVGFLAEGLMDTRKALSPMEAFAQTEKEDYNRMIARSTHYSHCKCEYCAPKNIEQQYEEAQMYDDRF